MAVVQAGYVFNALISPLTNLHTFESRSMSTVQFSFRRRNKTFTLQWETFEGYIVPAGTKNLQVLHCVNSLPSSSKRYLISIEYMGEETTGLVIVDPQRLAGTEVYFVLPHATTGANENVKIYGSCVTWHAEICSDDSINDHSYQACE
jgi:hypothetical protein